MMIDISPHGHDPVGGFPFEAYEKSIFGAPTFVSNNKIFWGQDRIEFAVKEASK